MIFLCFHTENLGTGGVFCKNPATGTGCRGSFWISVGDLRQFIRPGEPGRFSRRWRCQCGVSYNVNVKMMRGKVVNLDFWGCFSLLSERS